MHSVTIACTITTLITTYIYIASFKVQLSQQLHCSVSYRWGYRNRAATNNLRLNPSKARELIIYRKRPGFDPLGDTILSGATRVGSLRVLFQPNHGEPLR